jgi:hypothetical protein
MISNTLAPPIAEAYDLVLEEIMKLILLHVIVVLFSSGTTGPLVGVPRTQSCFSSRIRHASE